MIVHLCNTRLLLVLFLLGFHFAVSCVMASDIVISDDFVPGKHERKVGSELNDEGTEQGDAVWFANKAYIISEKDGGCVIPQNPGAVAAQIAVPEKSNSINLQATLKSFAEKAGWWGIGFSATKTKHNPNWPGGVFLIVDSDGWVRLFADGMRIKFKIVKVANFEKGQAVKLRLSYDKKTKILNAWANEQIVVSQYSFEGKDGFEPGMLYAGFSSFGLSKEAALSGFKAIFGQSQSMEKAQVKESGNTYKILFLGNSITRHGVSKKLNWNIVAGMAASSTDKDYAHLLASAIAAQKPEKKVEPYFKAYGGGVVPAYVGHAAEYKEISPDLVIVQLGENDREAQGIKSFTDNYEKILKDINSLAPTPMVICTGVWNPGGSAIYSGWSAQKEEAIKGLAKTNGALFVSVSAAASDPQCRGYGDTPGVRWHPNDKGMQKYAEAIYNVWKAGQ